MTLGQQLGAVVGAVLMTGCVFGSSTAASSAGGDGDSAGTTDGDGTVGSAMTGAPGTGSGSADGIGSTGPSVPPGTDDTTEPPSDDAADDDDDDDDATSTGPCPEVPWYPDEDADGFGDPAGPTVLACTAPDGHVDNDLDCDDATAAFSPEVDETCDGQDNDCDAAVDEWSPVNDSCGTCSTEVDGQNVYYYCAGEISWDAAQAACELKGATLVRIDDQPGNDDRTAGAAMVASGDFYIGLRYDGSDFRWTDDTITEFLNWRPGQPTFDGPCVELDTLDSGLWNDIPCDDDVTAVGWICQGEAS